jgi:catechol 2,3-dioxygenase-like lactoylglutathione lyase family enzyme
MKSQLAHLVFGIDSAHLPFYKDLLNFLGWTIFFDGYGMIGASGQGPCSIWFGPNQKAHANDHDGPGLNHLAISVESIPNVDAAVEYLKRIGTPALFETPRHRPDFAHSEHDTYYQVMFESPDRILFEIVYTGPK